MKKLILLLCVFALLGCSTTQEIVDEETLVTEVEESNDLPIKEDPNDVLMSTSPITTLNIEDYLFRDDTIYIDTRSVYQFQNEGHIAGFVNIPFYGLLVDYDFQENVLYTMDKIFSDEGEFLVGLGEVGSFFANYEESETYLSQLFPKNKNIIFISTAGVEASYLMNLLIQIGYDGSKLYNAGAFTNGIGSNIAYSTMEDANYLVKTPTVYNINFSVTWPELTEIKID